MRLNYCSEGKMKQKVTKEKVRVAIESLKSIGEKPTIDRIRRMTGGGNPLIIKFKNEIESENFNTESHLDNINEGSQHKKTNQMTQKERIIVLENQLTEIQELLKINTDNKIKSLERELEKYKTEYVKQKQIVKIQGDVIKRLRERLKITNPRSKGNGKILH